MAPYTEGHRSTVRKILRVLKLILSGQLLIHIAYLEEEIGMPMCLYGKPFHDGSTVGQIFYNQGALARAKEDLKNAPEVEIEVE